jgi:hypothetical protein
MSSVSPIKGSRLAQDYKMGLNAEIHQCVVCHVQVIYVFNEQCEWRREREGADLNPGITIRPWIRPLPCKNPW